jgi:hypothetical protein
MKSLKLIFIIVAALILLRLALPMIALRVINAHLANKLGTYEGHIEDFDLALYRGACELQGLIIQKKGSSDEPLLKVDQIDLSLAWRALFHRRISADVTLTKPALHLADSGKKENRQLGTEEPVENWRAVFHVLIPTTIESLAITDGQVDFVNRDMKTPLPVKIDQIWLETKDLRLQKTEETNPLKLTARLQEKAKIEITGKIALLGQERTLDLDFSILQFHMNSTNQVLRIYIPLDITKGTLSVYGEIAANKKEAIGYAKVFFKDGDIIAYKQNYLNVKHLAFEMIGAFANWFLQNQKNKSVEALVPFHYENKKWDVDASKAFWSSIKASKEGLKPAIDHRISLKSLKSEIQK